MTSTGYRPAVIVLCAAGIVVAVMQTIIVPLIPQLPILINTAPNNASWALTITLLVGAVTTPIAGRLGDMFGKRRVLIANMLAVAGGSAICAVAESLVPFLVGRGLQGVGIGTIAVGISIMRDVVPPTKLAASVGALSASLGVGGALGLPFAAAITEKISWHALFWVATGAALLGAIAIALCVPESPSRSGGAFDVFGALGLSAVLVAGLLPLSKGATWGWTAPLTLGLFAAFVVSSLLWWRYQRRASNALINLQMLTDKPILLTNIASVATGFAFYAMQMMPIQLLMGPSTAPGGLGFTMVVASLILMPAGFVMFGFSYVSAWLTRQRGARVSLATGGVIIGVGYAVFLAMLIGPWSIQWPWIFVAICFNGAGLGIAYAAMPALIMQVVPVARTGEANGVNSLMRSVGTSIATSAVGMILTASTITTTVGTTPVETPSLTAYAITTVICLAVCALAVVTALGIPAHSPLDTDDVV